MCYLLLFQKKLCPEITFSTYFHYFIYATMQPGYNPRKKLSVFYEYVTNRIGEARSPRQNLSIGEGCIPFKGRISFKFYNLSKIDNYHMKTFILVDSLNNFCLGFRLYTGIDDYFKTPFGKKHDLVMLM